MLTILIRLIEGPLIVALGILGYEQYQKADNKGLIAALIIILVLIALEFLLKMYRRWLQSGAVAHRRVEKLALWILFGLIGLGVLNGVSVLWQQWQKSNLLDKEAVALLLAGISCLWVIKARVDDLSLRKELPFIFDSSEVQVFPQLWFPRIAFVLGLFALYGSYHDFSEGSFVGTLLMLIFSVYSLGYVFYFGLWHRKPMIVVNHDGIFDTRLGFVPWSVVSEIKFVTLPFYGRWGKIGEFDYLSLLVPPDFKPAARRWLRWLFKQQDYMLLVRLSGLPNAGSDLIFAAAKHFYDEFCSINGKPKHDLTQILLKRNQVSSWLSTGQGVRKLKTLEQENILLLHDVQAAMDADNSSQVGVLLKQLQENKEQQTKLAEKARRRLWIYVVLGYLVVGVLFFGFSYYKFAHR